ncbi:DUF4421 family protein [Deminuibacter soli]|uniref:DUF4421 domain-containing protein n=1 Tax=Deminuibacter soli TaxID=2291815 RepID=A0A3E1NGJ3_9BACT|nr:DUF4421 family protein [Deminuibacter soli]RFM26908.1 DUF4421 domain-containing protein [Deminuibacter soli]
MKKTLFHQLPYSKALILCSMLLFAASVCAQDTARLRPVTSDSNWIEKYKDWIVLKLALENSAEFFSVNTDAFDYVFQPNPAELFRTYFSYRYISFYLTYIPHFLPGNNDDAEKGRTTGLGLGFGFNSHQWFTNADFSFTKGYYLENTKDFVPGWQPGDPYYQAHKLQVTSLGGSTGYNTNPRLSLAAVYGQTERQLKSAGAFLPVLSYRYFIINNKDTGITQKTNNFQLLLGAGYHHTFVVSKSLYLFGSFIPSFGYIDTRLLTRFREGNEITNRLSPVYQWEAKAGLGYNGRRFFSGLYLTANSSKHSQGLTTAVDQDGRVFLQLFAGYRFAAPKFLKRAVDKL